MRILPVNFNNHIFNSQTRKDLRINSFSPNYVSDSFTKSEAVSFQANTSAGNPLKKLKGLKCPYFGVEMISGADIARIEKRLDKCFNVKDAVKVLSKYTKYMQETEKKCTNALRRWQKQRLTKHCLNAFSSGMMKLL